MNNEGTCFSKWQVCYINDSALCVIYLLKNKLWFISIACSRMLRTEHLVQYVVFIFCGAVPSWVINIWASIIWATVRIWTSIGNVTIWGLHTESIPSKQAHSASEWFIESNIHCQVLERPRRFFLLLILRGIGWR